jgi:hypothetical protein
MVVIDKIEAEITVTEVIKVPVKKEKVNKTETPETTATPDTTETPEASTEGI